MGCHTWFYKKAVLQPSKEEIKERVVARLLKERNFNEQLINDRTSFDEDFLDAYPEFTPEYAKIAY